MGLVFLFAVYFIPLASFADEGAQTKAHNTGITYECEKTVNNVVLPGECDFDDLVRATKQLVDFGVKFTLSFSVVVLAYVGGEYMFYSDNPGARSKASARLWKVVLGIVYIMAAWLIVTLITNSLLKTDVSQLVPLGK